MRPLPLLGLAAGLALLAWGGYALYARFVGGPEVYWGRDRVAYLADLEKTLEDVRALTAREERELASLREELAAKPAGPLKEEIAKKAEEIAADAKVRAQVVEKSEALLDATRGHREEARGRAMRRGILFTLLGLLWSVRAGMAVFAPVRPKPATATPAPSPPSPRPDG